MQKIQKNQKIHNSENTESFENSEDSKNSPKIEKSETFIFFSRQIEVINAIEYIESIIVQKFLFVENYF